MKTTLKIILLAVILTACQSNPIDKACINETCFEIEIRDDDKERAEGLMNRTELENDKGMLFIFEEENIYSFWMKNTLIPLDIIWINENLKIVWIAKNVSPCLEDPCPSYAPQKKAKYVLEINANLSNEYNFKTGDNVQLQLRKKLQ